MSFQKKKKSDPGTFALVLAAFAVAGVATAVVTAPVLPASMLSSLDAFITGTPAGGTQVALGDAAELQMLLEQIESATARARAIVDGAGSSR